jgi:acyl carrier protein
MIDIRAAVRRFIIQSVLASDEATTILDDTPLNEDGLLDSLATMNLVAFLESEFRIEVHPEDLEAGRLSSLISIEQLVRERLREPA